MEQPQIPFTPFILLTPRLIIIPTPIAVNIQSYRKLYAALHANPVFCEMGFGPLFGTRQWSDDDTREVIYTRDIVRSWQKRGMGDFAVALRPKGLDSCVGRLLNEDLQLRIVEDTEYTRLADGEDFLGHTEQFEWVGYAGVRDATTTSMPERTADDLPLPPWNSMIEMRYGVAPDFWGKGIARTAAESVMQWAISERDVTRFIAETERENVRSGRVLEKMGFKLSGTAYWKDPKEVEWERLAD
jgi:RimJ/RimL family protein N-acetyltransferase